MPFDPRPYAARLRDENTREQAQITASSALAHEDAQRLADAIGRSDPSVAAVYLFGSLAAPAGPRHARFDIDLALDGGDVFRAEEICESSTFAVDVVSLQRLAPEMRERIIAGGRVLYVADGR